MAVPVGGGVIARGRRRLVRGVLITLALLILLLLALQAWLGTGIGRGVVESRLSAAFGRPVRLDGDFAVGIIPVPGASGTELRLFTSDGRWRVVDAGSFEARLELWPLLKGQVEVLALRLGDAGVDLGRLASEPRAAGETSEAYFRIPDIRDFELAGVSLYFEGMGSQPEVHIAELSVDDFEIDAPARFEAEIAVISGGEELVGISAAGDLTLWAGGIAEAALSRLDVALDGWRVSGLQGGFTADFIRSVFGIGLQLDHPDRPFSFGAQLAWDPAFVGESSGYLIEEVELVSGEQRITGDGCLVDGAPPVLHATLTSQELDLDALYALVDGWRIPANDAAGSVQGAGVDRAPMADDEAGLPVDLALRLQVARATYGDAVAEGIVFSAGSRPECPHAMDGG